MLIFARTSPLYQHTYTEIDMNTSIGVAKALNHGQIFMRDIFEQRGLYFYWLYQLPMKITHDNYNLTRNFIGLIETFNFSLVYYIFNKIKPNKLINLLMLTLIITGNSFSATGVAGEPETLTLFIVAYVIYLTYNYQKFSQKQNLILGILFGVLIEVKYGAIMPVVAFYLIVGFKLLWQKRFKMFIKTASIALLGVLVAQVPLVIYELIKHNLANYIHYYFFFNSSNLIDQSRFSGLIIANLLIIVPLIALTILPITFSFRNYKINNVIINLFIEFILSLIGISLIAHLVNCYSLPLTLYLWAMALPSFEQAYFSKSVPLVARIVLDTLFSMFVVLNIAISALNKYNTINESHYKQPLTPISKMINQQNGSVIMLDNLADNLWQENKSYPDLFHFERVNILYRNNQTQYLTQIKYLKTKKPDWVATRFIVKANKKPLNAEEHLFLHRPDLYIKQHLYKNFTYQKHNYYVYSTLPKALVKNYVCVYAQTENYKAYHQAREDYHFYMLWTRSSIAKKHHLKVIPKPWHLGSITS